MESRKGFFFVAHLVRTRQQWGDMAGIGFITQLVNHQLPWGTTPRGGSFGRHSCAFSDSFEHPQCRLGQINVGVWTSMKQRINRWLATCGLAWFNGSLQNLRIQTSESWFMVFVWAFRCISKSCNHWELFDVHVGTTGSFGCVHVLIKSYPFLPGQAGLLLFLASCVVILCDEKHVPVQQ